LQVAGILALLALAVPAYATRPGAAGALAAGAVALLGRQWPFKLGLLSGVLVGMAVAMLIDGQRDTAPEDRR
jgi:hypothetical protein